jgi:hypothetical protein
MSLFAQMFSDLPCSATVVTGRGDKGDKPALALVCKGRGRGVRVATCADIRAASPVVATGSPDPHAPEVVVEAGLSPVSPMSPRSSMTRLDRLITWGWNPVAAAALAERLAARRAG